ncbi:MAG: aspartyl-tRNA(Asn)/glutamyl-tRNA(Gln) amidotransferase subunit B [Patiriisocius sp.]|jgi:aspartyl-tRNA(Asn)/glutamyl-tRNA(Gln) amidotransferase subunit B
MVVDYDKYELVCGLEVHIQMLTKTKAYVSDSYTYGALPNTQISPITLGHPGTLPKSNKKVIEYGIKLGLACNSDISREMYYDRKNYFYADLPKGYQLTQDATPICRGGYITIHDKEGVKTNVELTRIHMEEDSGKSIHDQDPFNTLVDFNRAGVPLLEIVTEPVIENSDQAYEFLSEVRKLIRYLEICDGNMEEGSMRCDANVSVRLKGEKELGQRTEVKNMNSISNVKKAIEFETKRQIERLEAGEKIVMETRSFDAVNQTTFSLRAKSEAHDYRYFPEPDLQPLRLTVEEINDIQDALPPLPWELKEKYTVKFGLSDYDASILTEDKSLALYYEEVIKSTAEYKVAANWVIGDVKSWLNHQAVEISNFPITPTRIAELMDIIKEGKISHSVASQSVFPAMVKDVNKSPIHIAEALNLLQDSDESNITIFVKQALEKYPDKVSEYKNGNKGLIGLFMGEVMKLSQRKADPKAASKILKELLEN